MQAPHAVSCTTHGLPVLPLLVEGREAEMRHLHLHNFYSELKRRVLNLLGGKRLSGSQSTKKRRVWEEIEFRPVCAI